MESEQQTYNISRYNVASQADVSITSSTYGRDAEDVPCNTWEWRIFSSFHNCCTQEQPLLHPVYRPGALHFGLLIHFIIELVQASSLLWRWLITLDRHLVVRVWHGFHGRLSGTCAWCQGWTFTLALQDKYPSVPLCCHSHHQLSYNVAWVEQPRGWPYFTGSRQEWL